MSLFLNDGRRYNDLCDGRSKHRRWSSIMAPGKKLPYWLVLVLLPSLFIAGCSGPDSSSETLKMSSLADLPAEVRSAPVTVQQAYQFAVANPEVLSQIPCYCGCGAIGHTSNYACYVAGESIAGSLKID